MQQKLVTTSQAAKALGVDRSTVTRMASAGIIRGRKLTDNQNGPWVFTPQAIQAAKKRLEVAS